MALSRRCRPRIALSALLAIIGALPALAELGATTKYTGGLIDLDLKDAPLPGAFAAFAVVGSEDFGRMTVRTGPLPGRVTLKLSRVPWDQALDVMAQMNGLEWSRTGHTVRIARRGDQSASEAPRVSQLSELALDQIAFRGTMSMLSGGHLAILSGPSDTSGFAFVGIRLRDAQITAIDATSIAFRRSDGRRVKRTLYP
jgi:hypothetical protein